MNKKKLFLVCGPWGSGSSAVAGFLANAGLYAPGPYHEIPDPLTSDTYEMDDFRITIAPFVSEPDLHKVGDSLALVDALNKFITKHFLNNSENNNSSIMLKHPTSAFILPELSEVFDLRIILVLRKLDDIEKTRIRRGWPSFFGEEGAKVIYANVFNFLIESSISCYLLRYSDLLKNPVNVLKSISEFVEITPSKNEENAAYNFVTKR